MLGAVQLEVLLTSGVGMSLLSQVWRERRISSAFPDVQDALTVLVRARLIQDYLRVVGSLGRSTCAGLNSKPEITSGNSLASTFLFNDHHHPQAVSPRPIAYGLLISQRTLHQV